jgi:hypothetical protein
MKNYITHYAFQTLEGSNRLFFREFLSDVTTFDKLINRIDKFAESEHDKYGYSIGIHYQTADEAIFKFKGELYEIFFETFVKVHAFGNILDITDYQNTKKDYPGVDAIGKVQGKKVAIQIKFLSNPKNHVDKDDMMNFYAVATGDLGIAQNNENLILFTSSYEGIDYAKMNGVFRAILQKNIRIINHKIISHFIDNNQDLWERVIKFIEESVLNLDTIKSTINADTDRELILLEKISSLTISPDKASPYKKYTIPAKITSKTDSEGNPIFKPARDIYNYSQLECYEKMQSTDVLTVILPTGTGKGYLLFIDLLSRIFYKRGKVFAICSHRIGLNKQHTMDMFEEYKDFIGTIGYIFIASETYQESDEKRSEYVACLKTVNPNSHIDDLISTLKPGQSLQEVIDLHHRNGRSVVIVSTYHSMQKLHGVDIDVIYCDEADKMIGSKPSTRNGIKEETFMQKFNKIRVRNRYALTATPKDWSKSWGGENIEFMNNEAIFGERIEMEFHAAVKCGYILQPYLHIVYPLEYVEEDLDCPDEENMDEAVLEISDVAAVKDMNVNIKAKIKMIVDAFTSHRGFLKDRSAQPDKIGAKLLIKCKNIRHEMWGIFHEGLREALPNIKIFAGGSYGYEGKPDAPIEYRNNNHYMYDPTAETTLIPIADRDSYLASIKGLKLEEDAIVLHCDILSEGINVKGFTGVCFVSGITQTDAKALQNIGRATRIIDEDRSRLNSGDIMLDDMSKWIKPFCSVIIPFWNAESAEAKDKMVNLVTELRGIGFEIEKFGTGSDINRGDENRPDMEEQNEPAISKRKSGIRELEQRLEELEHLQKINNMNPVDFIIEMTNDVFPNSKEFSDFWSN